MKIPCLTLGIAIVAIAQVPTISPGGIQNAANYANGPIAPGEIVVIYGSGLGPRQLVQSQSNTGSLIVTQLAGTVVFFNSITASIIYTSATQVAAIVPYELTGTSAFVEVQYNGATSVPKAVTLAASVPGIFTSNASGGGLAAAVNLDGSINGPSHPVTTNGYISLFATGEGQTSPSGQDGKLASAPLPQPLASVSATVGGSPATVLYAGGAPGEVAGVMQVNLQIPANVPLGSLAPVILNIGRLCSI